MASAALDFTTPHVLRTRREYQAAVHQIDDLGRTACAPLMTLLLRLQRVGNEFANCLPGLSIGLLVISNRRTMFDT